MPGLGIGLGVGLGGSAGGGGPGLSPSKTTYPTSIAQGSAIATLSDPYGSGSTYSVVGSAPATLALGSGGNIVAGNGQQTEGQSSTIIVRATKGSRAVEEPLIFTAKGAAPIVIGPQMVASFTAIPNGANVTMGSYVRALARNGHVAGPVGFSKVQIVDAAFRVASGSGVEQTHPSSFEIQRSIEIGSVVTRGTYAGATSKTVAPGDLPITDVMDVTVPAGATFWTRREAVVQSTDTLVAIGIVGADQQGFRTNGASQLMAAGTMNNSGTGSGPQIMPAAIIAVPSAPMASVIAVVDSIGTYLNDTNSATTQGFINRAMVALGVPLHKQGVQGATLVNASPSAAPLQKQLWKYGTDVMIQQGTNDLAGLTSGTEADRLATMQARFRALAELARSTMGPYGRRLRVHALPIIPRGTFDSARENVRVAYNSWLAAGADGLVDVYHNTLPAAGTPADYSDQVHPPSAIHDAMAAILRESFRPYMDPLR